MIKSLLSSGLIFIFLSSATFVFGQADDRSFLVTTDMPPREYEAPEDMIKKATVITNTTKDFYRHHKRLPVTFEGYVIELTTSDFPLNRDYHLFEQFGKVYYDQVPGEGYSYIILIDFSSKKAIEEYIGNIVIHKAPEARLFEYKKGSRILR